MCEARPCVFTPKTGDHEFTLVGSPTVFHVERPADGGTINIIAKAGHISVKLRLSKGQFYAAEAAIHDVTHHLALHDDDSAFDAGSYGDV